MLIGKRLRRGKNLMLNPKRLRQNAKMIESLYLDTELITETTLM